MTKISYIPYVHCAHCDKPVFHMLPDQHADLDWYIGWSCPKCGEWTQVRCITPGKWESRKSINPDRNTKWPEYWVLLQLPAHHPRPISVLLKHRRCPDWDPSTDVYHYNEGTCPINYLRNNIEAIADGSEKDPHGIFTFIKSWLVADGDHEDDVMMQITESL